MFKKMVFRSMGYNFRYENEKFIQQLTMNPGNNNNGPMAMVLNPQFFTKTDKIQHPLEMFTSGSASTSTVSASQEKSSQEIAKPHVCKFCNKKFAR